MSVSRNVTAPVGQPASRPLVTQLARDEAHRHDAVLLGGLEQPLPGAVAAVVALEAHLAEPASALRTWASSWMGSRRLPDAST